MNEYATEESRSGDGWVERTLPLDRNTAASQLREFNARAIVAKWQTAVKNVAHAPIWN
jgi:hypothetical protein